jgi:hypothetical protein
MNFGRAGLLAACASAMRPGTSSAAPPAAPYCKNRLREIRVAMAASFATVPAARPSHPRARRSSAEVRTLAADHLQDRHYFSRSDPALSPRPCSPARSGLRGRRRGSRCMEGRGQRLRRPQPFDPGLPDWERLLEAAPGFRARVFAQRQGRRAREDRRTRALPRLSPAGAIRSHNAAPWLASTPACANPGSCARRRELQVRRRDSLGSAA